MKICRPRFALLGPFLLFASVMYGFSFVILRQWQPKQYIVYNSFNSTVRAASLATSDDVKPSYISVVTRRASDDKFIILTVADDAVVDMAVNLYKSSFKPHNIDNFLFVAFGAQTCAKLVADSIPCFRYTNFNGTSQASVYESVEFLSKMAVRNSIILETLKAGFTVLLIDLDIVFFHNPLPDLKVNKPNVNNWPMSRLPACKIRRLS
jgi:Nucleotide-diphospho-sugar transferase